MTNGRLGQQQQQQRVRTKASWETYRCIIIISSSSISIARRIENGEQGGKLAFPVNFSAELEKNVINS